MKKLAGISLCFYLILSGLTASQDTNIVKYFPINVGNVWVYRGNAAAQGGACNITFYQKIFIDSSKFLNGKIYFKFNVQTRFLSGQGNCGYNFIQNGAYYRVDSVSGNIYKYASNYTECPGTLYETLIDSLKSKIGDTSYTCTGGMRDPVKRMSDTSDYIFLALSLKSKKFYGPVASIDYFYDNTYSRNFGLVRYGNFGPADFSSRCDLKGCIINGMLYGDTAFSLIGINQISSEIPNNFKLHQNYPNPFNPVTQIKFDIPNSSFVNLIIYDAAGREVKHLVDEELTAGNYSVDWAASSNPSGVYFYKITAGEFVQTRKMVLVK